MLFPPPPAAARFLALLRLLRLLRTLLRVLRRRCKILDVTLPSPDPRVAFLRLGGRTEINVIKLSFSVADDEAK
jgi:hypothetical protein